MVEKIKKDTAPKCGGGIVDKRPRTSESPEKMTLSWPCEEREKERVDKRDSIGKDDWGKSSSPTELEKFRVVGMMPVKTYKN